MLKRIVSSVTALALMVGAVNIGKVIPYNAAPMTAYADRITGTFDFKEVTYDNTLYRKYEDHAELIHGDEEAERFDIPAEVDGLPVTRIGDMAFWKCQSLTEVTIPDTVKEIDWGAFFDCSLRSVVLPDSLEYLNGSTFAWNNDLSEVTIPESLTNFCGTDFQGTKWLARQQAIDPLVVVNNILIDGTTCEGDVIVPDTVTKISDCAFDYNNDITSIIIPDSVTSLGSAFYACENLASVSLPDSITEIEGNTFAWCISLPDITIPDSVTSIGKTAFHKCYSFTEITIPDSVTSIGESAFSTCMELTSVKLPDSITKINQGVFANCEKLTDITIPDSVTEIGYGSFANCGFTEITLPDSIVSIEGKAFGSCKNLTSITIPASVESIDSWAFYNCPVLSEITILNPECELGDSETTISNDAYTYKNDDEELHYDGVIRGYENSTAQAHAEKYGYTFECLGETTAYTFEELLKMDKSEICAISEHIAEYYEDMQIFYLNFLADYTQYGITFSMKDWDEKYNIRDEQGLNTDLVKEMIYNDVALPENILSFDLSSLIPVTGTENGEPYKDMLITGRFRSNDYYGNPIYDYNDMYVFLRFAVYMELNPYVRGVGFQRAAGAPSYKAGDVNNDRTIDSTDASDVLAEYSLTQTGKQGAFTRVQKSVADVNGDGRVDSLDASEILAYYSDSLTGKAASWN